MLLFFLVKQKARIHDLSFLRLFFGSGFVLYSNCYRVFSLNRIVFVGAFFYHFTGGFMPIGGDAFL
ncbi:hypothetical protein SEEJ0720_21736 [Salmonella enterica subsp. enterica serovar Javiana str. PRS_2010_0720]|nr:hypothetical protein SEEJ0720_21736 [Salmonella enterica subsp. enterica serovar Javiana str. PRS_2010_0720]